METILKIPLGKSKKFTIIDKEFYYLSKYKWYCNSSGYAVRTIKKNGKKVCLFLHRIINNTIKGMDTDHINRNKLDNRKCNLRSCTRQQNKFNQNNQKNNKSGFMGVFYEKDKRCDYFRWRAQIKINQKIICLGSFKNKNDAIRARQNALFKYI